MSNDFVVKVGETKWFTECYPDYKGCSCCGADEFFMLYIDPNVCLEAMRCPKRSVVQLPNLTENAFKYFEWLAAFIENKKDYGESE